MPAASGTLRFVFRLWEGFNMKISNFHPVKIHLYWKFEINWWLPTNVYILKFSVTCNFFFFSFFVVIFQVWLCNLLCSCYCDHFCFPFLFFLLWNFWHWGMSWFIQDSQDSNKMYAAMFSPFWNEIIKSLREEDFISNR